MKKFYVLHKAKSADGQSQQHLESFETLEEAFLFTIQHKEEECTVLSEVKIKVEFQG